MSLIDGAAYALPDGTPLRAQHRGGNLWHLLGSDGRPCFLVIDGHIQRLVLSGAIVNGRVPVYDMALCDLTLDDLNVLDPSGDM